MYNYVCWAGKAMGVVCGVYVCVCWTGKAMGVACGVYVCVCVGQVRPWEWRVV